MRQDEPSSRNVYFRVTFWREKINSAHISRTSTNFSLKQLFFLFKGSREGVRMKFSLTCFFICEFPQKNMLKLK